MSPSTAERVLTSAFFEAFQNVGGPSRLISGRRWQKDRRDGERSYRESEYARRDRLGETGPKLPPHVPGFGPLLCFRLRP